MRKIATLFFGFLLAGQAWATNFEVDGLTFTIVEGTTNVIVSACFSLPEDGALTIPQTVTNPNDGEDYTVTGIGKSAFSDKNYLTSVTIPNSVTTIGDNAFYSCSGLTSITIPNSVTSIGDASFYHCESLKTITIPESVTTIYSAAFCMCTALTSITIPESVTFIGNYVFSGCYALPSISLPKGITTIYYNTFQDCRSLTSIEIPDGVTTIEGNAFGGCSALTSVTIPSSVTTFSNGAFNGCDNLIYTKENGLKYLGNSENAYHALMAPESTDITSCTINNNCKIIGGGAFSNCENLSAVSIPGSVTIIGGSAFSGCTSLTSVTIPNSVTSIGSSAFFGCSSLSAINVDDGNASYSSENGVLFNKDKTKIVCYPNAKASEYDVPVGVDTIGEMAFSSCNDLTSVTIPEGVTVIGDAAFSQCKNLKSITIPASVTSCEYVFYGCTDETIIYYRGAELPIEWNPGVCTVVTNCKILNVATNNAQYGAVSAAGYIAKSADGSLWYENNAKATLTATAQEGYHFAKWADNNDTNATRTFNVTADATFTAVFEENTNNGGNNNPATAVDESAANAVNIYAYGNTIVVENATDEIYVYNAMGGLVCRDAARHVSTITVNGPGVYIVKTGGIVKRVMAN